MIQISSPCFRRPNHPEPNPEVELDEEVDFNSGFILPRLPRGKKMVDTVVSTDVDSLYKVSCESQILCDSTIAQYFIFF